jgi:L-ascorbate metabolism protein UlaG (beta-lactamase superfamily)
MAIDNRLSWINHAGFYFKTAEMTIFVDPFKLSDEIKEKADMVLITHPHYDHCSKDDLEKVITKDTKIIAPKGVLPEWKEKIIVSKPGFEKDFGNLSVSAIPAYNTNPKRLDFHKKKDEWVGYVIDIDGFRFYHPGDTDFIPEMRSLKELDLALLPIGGTYTMDVNEAIEATKNIDAKSFAPMHYKALLGESGSLAAENEFKKRVKNAVILKQVQKPSYSF